MFRVLNSSVSSLESVSIVFYCPVSVYMQWHHTNNLRSQVVLKTGLSLCIVDNVIQALLHNKTKQIKKLALRLRRFLLKFWCGDAQGNGLLTNGDFCDRIICLIALKSIYDIDYALIHTYSTNVFCSSYSLVFHTHIVTLILTLPLPNNRMHLKRKKNFACELFHLIHYSFCTLLSILL